jgi:hypothetical protein
VHRGVRSVQGRGRAASRLGPGKRQGDVGGRARGRDQRHVEVGGQAVGRGQRHVEIRATSRVVRGGWRMTGGAWHRVGGAQRRLAHDIGVDRGNVVA